MFPHEIHCVRLQQSGSLFVTQNCTLQYVEQHDSFTDVARIAFKLVWEKQFPHARCFAQNTIAENSEIIAIGFEDGAVQTRNTNDLLSLYQTNQVQQIRDGSPSQQDWQVPGTVRSVRSLRWCNKAFDQQNLLTLGVAMEKAAKSDRGFYVYDGHVQNSIFEAVPGDTVGSFDWLEGNSNSIVIGLQGQRQLQLYDIRAASKSVLVSQTATRALFGIKCDPVVFGRFASFFDKQIFIWDCRSINRPLTTYYEPSNVKSIVWAEDRRDVLYSLHEHSRYVRRLSIIELNDADVRCAAHSKRVNSDSFAAEDTITSFDVFPSHSSDFIVLSSAGRFELVHTKPDQPKPRFHPGGDLSIPVFGKVLQFLQTTVCHSSDFIVLSSAGRFELVHTKPDQPKPRFHPGGDLSIPVFGKVCSATPQLMTKKSEQTDAVPVDISSIMHSRLKAGYHSTDVREKMKVLQREQEAWFGGDSNERCKLVTLFKWLQRMQALRSNFPSQWSDVKLKFPGAAQLFPDPSKAPSRASDACSKMKSVNLLSKRSAAKGQNATDQYMSPARNRILRLCGWGTVDPASPEHVEVYELIKELRSSGHHERAAFIALATGQYQEALNCLEESKHPESNALTYLLLSADTLSPGECRNMFLSNMRAQTKTWTNAYLVVLIRFVRLIVSNESLINLLSDVDDQDDPSQSGNMDWLLEDKIGYCALYVSDQMLFSQLTSLARRKRRHSNTSTSLEPLLITGFGDEGKAILQKYIDVTGDVQSAVLICLQAYSLPKDFWFKGYKNLLNMWREFDARADIQKQHSVVSQYLGIDVESPAPSAMVYHSCTFCARNSKPDMHPSKFRPLTANNRDVTCSRCRRALPRCVTCNSRIGAGPTSLQAVPSNLLVWCMQCRHASHCYHIAEWRMDEYVCPVAGCECRCWADNAPDFATSSEEDEDGIGLD